MKKISKKSFIFILIFIILLITIYILFMLDINNFPTKIGIKNVNLQNWLISILEIIETIIGALIGAIIGGYVSFYILKVQLIQEKKQNDELKIAQNYPLLIYTFYSNEKLYNDCAEKLIGTLMLGNDYYSKEGYTTYESVLKIENCGLNLAKNVKFEISVLNLNDKCYKSSLFDDTNQIVIKKDGNIYINILSNLKIQTDDVCNFKLVCTYEDIFNNVYVQSVIYSMKPANTFGSSSFGYSTFCKIKKITIDKR